jgi:serine/threonine protein kinase
MYHAQVHQSKDYAFMVMEIVKAGSLKAFLKYRRLKFESIRDEEASSIVRQILEGVVYLHNLDIIHRDLKLQNILLRSFHAIDNAVKIADFGFGTQGRDAATEKCGTLIYMAPELLTSESYRKVRDGASLDRRWISGRLGSSCTRS